MAKTRQRSGGKAAAEQTEQAALAEAAAAEAAPALDAAGAEPVDRSPLPAAEGSTAEAPAAGAAEGPGVPGPGAGADSDGTAEQADAEAGDVVEAGEAGTPSGPEEWVGEVPQSFLQSKYTLVSVAAKRARQILAGSPPRVETLSEKPVTIALEELTQGKLYFEQIRGDE